MRGQPRQPLKILLDVAYRPVNARQAHGHVVAQPVERVVGPGRLDRRDGQVGPVRELRGQQPLHEGSVCGNFVDVHLASGH